MDKNASIMVGLGEVLWEVWPENKVFGKGPGNFAYYASVLGNRGIVASKVGADELGKETLENLKNLNLETEFIQTDELAPTGTIIAEVDPKGPTKFTVTEEVAWDYFEWTDQWELLAQQANAVCFGSMGQRCYQSYHATRRFLRAVSLDCLRIFDVNLRQSYYCVEKINESMQIADIVKLNENELPQVFRVLGLKPGNLKSSARTLLDNYGLKMVVLTRDQRGCMLVTEKQSVEHQGFKIKLVDELGAGDAFSAAIAHHYLKGTSLDKMAEAANRLAAYVASRPGSMVQVDKNTLNLVLSPAAKKPGGNGGGGPRHDRHNGPRRNQ